MEFLAKSKNFIKAIALKAKSFFCSLYSENNGKKLFGLSLFAIILLVQCIYCFHIAPPQLGWWQYYGWQVSSGSVLYKDIYCFLNPYFVWLMALLYSIFGANFIWYAIIGVILRTFSFVGIYSILTRKLKPLYALLCTLIGFFISIVYLSDMAFDYNMLINYLIILITYLSVKLYEAQTARKKLILIITIGLLCGIHFMTKQSSGLIVSFFVALVIFIMDIRENDWRYAIKNFGLFMAGVFGAIIPGYVAILATGAFPAYIDCLFGSTGAKMTNGLLDVWERYKNIMFHWEEIVAAVFLALSSFIVVWTKLASQKNNDAPNKKDCVWAYVRFYMFLACVMIIAIAFIIAFVIYFIVNPASGTISQQTSSTYIGYMIGLLIVCLLGSGTITFILTKKFKTLPQKFKFIFYLAAVVFIVGFIVMLWLGNSNFLFEIYNKFPLHGMSTIIVDISFYFTLLYVIGDTVYYLITKRFIIGREFYIFSFIMLALTGSMLLSSVLEEITAFSTLIIIFTFCWISGSCLIQNRKCIAKNKPALKTHCAHEAEIKTAEDDCKPNRTLTLCSTIRSMMHCGLAIILFVAITLSVTCKIVVPYNWHSWRVTPIATDLNHVSSNIDELKGYKLSEYDEWAYTEIIRLIEENSSKDDTLYQFPNVPLFNVLTKRKAPTYAPIHYWDVCPDNIAEQAVDELKSAPPKIIIWMDLTEITWRTHEIYFRNDNPSGQRKLLEFYESYVKSNYELLGEFHGAQNPLEDNTGNIYYQNLENASLQVWVLK